MEFRKKEDRSGKTTGRGRSRRPKKHLPVESTVYGNEDDQLQVRLQMYRTPPTETIGLTEFEELALERLKILKAVERAGVTHIKGTTEYKAKLKEELGNVNKIYTTERREHYGETVRKDVISHFILRLAYSKTEDLRRWLILTECDYFRYRFNEELKDPERLGQFLLLNGLEFEAVEEEEKGGIIAKLTHSSPVQLQPLTLKYYKVPFTDVLDLVRKRSVYIERGCAFVSQTDLVSIIIGGFRANLSLALTKTSRFGHLVVEDPRLRSILQNLPKRHLGKRYDEKSGALDNLTASMIPSLTQSFPPCMQKLYSSLREHHHLKHQGRQQYWNFLKGIGMPMEETINHTREEFVKMMDPDKFDKEHRYNIRHSYGQEGKKTNYSPFSCMKIITSNPPGPGDYHGCPFRHTDSSLLQQRLVSGPFRITDSAAKVVVDFAKENHFQVACSCYYEAVHNIELKTSGLAINHPNQYFKESQMLLHPEKFDKKFPPFESQTQTQVKLEPTSVQTKVEPTSGQTKVEPTSVQTKLEADIEKMKEEFIEMDDF